MKKHVSAAVATAALVTAALATLAACGTTPTGSSAGAPAEWQANTAEQDTTGRVPNMMGSGN